jgi:putative membrane protein
VPSGDESWIAALRAGPIVSMDTRNTDQASSDRHTSDHLANERTFLAWIRTSISVMGLGFVVAKFSVWIRELAVSMGRTTPIPHSSLSMPLGIGLMIFGGLLAVTAAWRYRAVKNALVNGKSATAEGTTVAVTIVVVAIAAALIAYMLASA